MKYANILLLVLVVAGCGDGPSKKGSKAANTSADMATEPDAGRSDGGAVDDGGDGGGANGAPSFSNLPAEEFGMRGEADAYQLIASDPDPDDTLTYALSSTTCPFDVQVLADTGLVSWQCAAETLSCEAILQVKDDAGLSDEGALSIGCVRSLPVFSTTPPTEAAEGELYSYAVGCDDPDGGAVSLSVGTSDSCGGQVQGTVYTWTPSETQGGTECTVQLQCSNGETAESQSVLVSVQETNLAPTLAAVAPLTADLGDSTSVQATASDSDIPAQTLTFSIDATSCGFDIDVSPRGLISLQCTTSGSCDPVLRVSDGIDIAETTLSVDCLEPAPPLKISAGNRHTCIVTPGGGVRCWGSNYDGRVGGTTSTASNDPVPPTTPSGMTSGVTDISAGGLVTCAVQNDAAKCWGSGAWGVIGPSTTSDTPTPTTILAGGVTQVATGSVHACAIQSGALKCWGANQYGELGNTTGNDMTFGSNPSPTVVAGLASGVTKVAMGAHHTCAIQNGALKCFGYNYFGQLGVNTNTQSDAANPVPTTVAGLASGVTDVAAGAYFTCAVHLGDLKCWGDGGSDQLGVANLNWTATPTTVNTGAFSQFSVGGDNVCVVQNGVQSCWGSNLYDQLLSVSGNSSATAVVVRQATVSAMSIGENHICAQQNGSLYCWGDNFGGQLGNDVNAGQVGGNPPTVVNY